MDEQQYSTLHEALAVIPDPRQARGKRHGWQLILTLVAAAVSNGVTSVKGIGRWIRCHQADLEQRLQPGRGLPSESTVRRALQDVNLAALEAQVGAVQPQPVRQPAKPPRWRGQSIDGKAVRGLRRYGQKLHLVSLVAHAPTVVLRQVAVSEKRNEISAVPQLLAGCDLTGTVTTMDALLCQRALCQQIIAQAGHYLVVVKANHPALYEAIDLLFTANGWTVAEKACEVQVHRTCEKGHGRIETRTLEASTTLVGYLDWPGCAQVLRRHCQRLERKTGKLNQKTTYAITSLSPHQADAATLAALWRAHWSIENRVHYVRDVTMGEDASHLRTGNAPHALAAFRNAILSLLRYHGWSSIPDAFQFYAASLDRTLQLLGARSPIRL
jgi:predicted transposase YbfD/YdcC